MRNSFLQTVSVADIPGIIKDAHKNKGLGISFLRHIERCVCLIYVIDLGLPDPVEQFETLRFELEQYSKGLSQRPHAVIANKIDLPDASENFERLREYAKKNGIAEVICTSAKHGTNLRQVLDFVRRMKEVREVKDEVDNEDADNLS